MKKQTFLYSLLMAIVMMAMSPMTVLAYDEPGKISGGDYDGYYELKTVNDLLWFNENGGTTGSITASTPMKNAILANDITFNSDVSNPTNYWVPKTNVYYHGILNGNGHKIKGLVFSTSNTGTTKASTVYLFNHLTKYSTIKNLTIEDSKYEASDAKNKKCGLVYNNYGTIDNCTMSVTFVGNYGNGFAFTNNGFITNCTVTSTFTGFQSFGIVNTNSYSSTNNPDGAVISGCFIQSTFQHNGSAGIATSNKGSSSTGIAKIYNCKSSSTFTGVSCYGILNNNSNDYTVLENCYFDGKLADDQSCFAIINELANQYGTVNNCYYLSSTKLTSHKTPTRSTSVDDTDVTSGKLCYLLNKCVTDGKQAWYQTVGVGSPTLTKNADQTVYPATLACDGTALTFSNTKTTPANPDHQLTEVARVEPVDQTDGMIAHWECTVCHKYFDDSEASNELTEDDLAIHVFNDNGICYNHADAFQPVTYNEELKRYEIGNAAQLASFRNYVNKDASHASADAVLTADIDLTAFCSSTIGTWVPIADQASPSKAGYCGTFDGQGHKITNLYINSDSQYQGLFSKLAQGAVIKNLSVNGTINGTNGLKALVAGYMVGSTIHNVSTSGSVECSKGAPGAGIVAKVDGKADSKISCCFNEASVSGYTVGGILGESTMNTTNLVIENCGNIGNLKNTRTNSTTGYSIGGIAGSLYCLSISSCYSTGKIEKSIDVPAGQLIGYLGQATDKSSRLCFLEANGAALGQSASTSYTKKLQLVNVTSADLTSGKVAYLLQSDQDTLVWGQNITTDPKDAYPVLGGDTVFATHAKCDGMPYDDSQFTNDGTVARTRDAHIASTIKPKNQLIPTCVSEGYDEFNCSVCTNDYRVVTPIDPDNHDYSDKTITETAGTDGFYHYVCAYGCGNPSADKILLETVADYPTVETDIPYDITIMRTMKGGMWNTLCLPFAMTEEEVKANFGDDAVVLSADGSFINILLFDEATEIEACKPYIIKPKNNISAIEVTDKPFATSSSDCTYIVNTPYCFKSRFYHSVLTAHDAEKAGIIYILNTNRFYRVDSDVDVRGFRWYFTINSDESGKAAKVLYTNLDDFDDIATGISNVDANDNGSATYNLAGQRINAAVKGIVIKNGRKYINK